MRDKYRKKSMYWWEIRYAELNSWTDAANEWFYIFKKTSACSFIEQMYKKKHMLLFCSSTEEEKASKSSFQNKRVIEERPRLSDFPSLSFARKRLFLGGTTWSASCPASSGRTTWRSGGSARSVVSASPGCETPCGKTRGRCRGTWRLLEADGRETVSWEPTHHKQHFVNRKQRRGGISAPLRLSSPW